MLLYRKDSLKFYGYICTFTLHNSIHIGYSSKGLVKRNMWYWGSNVDVFTTHVHYTILMCNAHEPKGKRKQALKDYQLLHLPQLEKIQWKKNFQPYVWLSLQQSENTTRQDIVPLSRVKICFSTVSLSWLSIFTITLFLQHMCNNSHF